MSDIVIRAEGLGKRYRRGVTGPPETFFINRQGLVVSKIAGPVDPHQLDVYVSLLGP